MSSYIALAHPAKDGGFGVSFPDLPGCISGGDNLEDAQRQAAEALAFHIDSLKEDGKAVPKARIFNTIKRAKNPWYDLDDAVVIYVPLLPAPSRTVRTTMTIDERLLAKVDTVSKNRSGFFSDAAWYFLRHTELGEQPRKGV